MSNVLAREFNGQVIGQRGEDGYMDATAMCKANGRRLSTYLRAQSTKAFISELSTVVQICTTNLIQVRQGGSAREQATYVHPRVATHLAQWCSAKFAVLVSGWVLDILTKGRAEVAPASDPLIALMEATISIRRSQIEQERRMAAVELEAKEAKQLANAAQQTSECNFGWFSVLGYSNRIGRQITVQEAAAVGKRLTSIMRRSGQSPRQVSDPRFGLVNIYPESLLAAHLGEEPANLPLPSRN